MAVDNLPNLVYVAMFAPRHIFDAAVFGNFGYKWHCCNSTNAAKDALPLVYKFYAECSTRGIILESTNVDPVGSLVIFLARDSLHVTFACSECFYMDWLGFVWYRWLQACKILKNVNVFGSLCRSTH